MSKEVLENECFNLDKSFYQWVYPRLKTFHEMVIGYGGEYKSLEEFKDDIQKQIDKLEIILGIKIKGKTFEQVDKMRAEFNTWFGSHISQLWI